MNRKRIRSVLALVALVVPTAVVVGQPPPPTGKSGSPGKERKAPPAGSLEAAIATAERNHPDVRLAEAKLRVAEAELAQAKLLAAQRVAVTYSKVEVCRLQVRQVEEDFRRMEKVIAQGGAPKSASREADLAAARATLAAAEADLRAAQGLAPGAATADDPMARVTLRQAEFLARMLDAQVTLVPEPPPPGSPLDRLKALAEKRVALEIKAQVPFDRAMTEFLKASGLTGLTVRLPAWASAQALKDPPMVGPLVGEQTGLAWFQLILDDFNREVAAGKFLAPHGGKYEIYVRDYGLLMTRVDLAPPGALTLAEFARIPRK